MVAETRTESSKAITLPNPGDLIEKQLNTGIDLLLSDHDSRVRRNLNVRTLTPNLSSLLTVPSE